MELPCLVNIVWPEPTIGSNAITDTAEVTNSPTEVAKDETVDRGGNSSKTISSTHKDTPSTPSSQAEEVENEREQPAANNEQAENEQPEAQEEEKPEANDRHTKKARALKHPPK